MRRRFSLPLGRGRDGVESLSLFHVRAVVEGTPSPTVPPVARGERRSCSDSFRRGGKGNHLRNPFPLALFLFLLTGCHLSAFPDPNDPKLAGGQQAEVLRRQVKGASDALFARVVGGEITDKQYKDLLAEYTDNLLNGIRIERLDPKTAWQYGEVFRTGRMWDKAEATYRIAVRAARDDDRRVNDTLGLAEALAQEDKVAEAIKEARETFDAPPTAKAPILYGVLYQIVPAGRGKGKDAALARLLEDAIRQSDLVKVDETTEAGKAFVLALPHHQHNARRLAADLYLSSGHDAETERVLGGKLPTLRI